MDHQCHSEFQFCIEAISMRGREGEAPAGRSSRESKSAGRRDAEGERHWLRESEKAGFAGIRGWKDGTEPRPEGQTSLLHSQHKDDPVSEARSRLLAFGAPSLGLMDR